MKPNVKLMLLLLIASQKLRRKPSWMQTPCATFVKLSNVGSLENAKTMDFDFIYFIHFKRFCSRGMPDFLWGRSKIASCSQERAQREKNARVPASEQDGVCDTRDLACFAARFPAVAALATWSHEACFMEHEE